MPDTAPLAGFARRMCAALLLAACANSSAAHAEGPNVTDDIGRMVTLTSPAQRVVSLSPHATELIAAAGGLTRLVGIDAASDYPPGLAAIPRLGSGIQYSAEMLLSARPDLLVTWQPGHTRHLPAGVTAYVSAPQTLDALPATIRKLGHLMDTDTLAGPAADALEKRLTRLAQRPVRPTPVPVFVAIGIPPYYTVNGHHIISDMLRRCGARNVYEDAQAASPRISVEGVLAAAPAVILSATPPAGVNANVPAALAGLPRIEVDADALFRPGPRLIDVTETVCDALDTLTQAQSGRGP